MGSAENNLNYYSTWFKKAKEIEDSIREVSKDIPEIEIQRIAMMAAMSNAFNLGINKRLEERADQNQFQVLVEDLAIWSKKAHGEYSTERYIDMASRLRDKTHQLLDIYNNKTFSHVKTDPVDLQDVFTRIFMLILSLADVHGFDAKTLMGFVRQKIGFREKP